MPFFILVCIWVMLTFKGQVNKILKCNFWPSSHQIFRNVPVLEKIVPPKLWCFLLECGRTLQDRSGTFTSPGFPRSQKYKLCEWRISMTPGERISLNFTIFGLRRGSNKCKDEYVEIRDGHFKSSPLIGKYCGKRTPPAIWSTGSRLWIKYSSGDVVGRLGFKASYKGERTFVHICLLFVI